jgi:hypothetical protein
LDLRHEDIVLETDRYRIEGKLTLPREGYRSRLSDYVNQRDREFFAINDATVTALDAPEVTRRATFLGAMTWRLTAALLGTAAACVAAPALATSEEPESGVRGSVKSGPTCPAEHPGAECAPREYKTVIRVRTVPGDEFVKRIHTGPHGGFRAELAPGSYRLTPQSGHPFPSCDSRKVTVKAGTFTRVRFVCDSGIR